MQVMFVEGQMATVMSGRAAECLCAMFIVTAVAELVTIQANQKTAITRVMVHHPGVVTLAGLVHTTSSTEQPLLHLVALPAETASGGKAAFARHILLAF